MGWAYKFSASMLDYSRISSKQDHDKQVARRSIDNKLKNKLKGIPEKLKARAAS